MTGDTLVYILLALPGAVSILCLIALRPQPGEDDAYGLPNGDAPFIPHNIRGD